MNREINFRAWHEETKNMNKPSSLMEIATNSYMEEDEFHEFIWMQYSGLKDQLNKNEVYEHDIIYHIEHGYLKVEWDYRDTGWVCIGNNYNKYNLSDILLRGGIKVGNIYENKDLLNG